MADAPYIKAIILDESDQNIDYFTILAAESSKKHLLIHKDSIDSEKFYKFNSFPDLLEFLKGIFLNISNFVPKILTFDKRYSPEFCSLVCELFITNTPDMEEKVKLFWLEE